MTEETEKDFTARNVKDILSFNFRGDGSILREMGCNWEAVNTCKFLWNTLQELEQSLPGH